MPDAAFHPVSLPTLLPCGIVRMNVIAARVALGLPAVVPGDCERLPLPFALYPYRNEKRVIGVAIYDEIERSLVFSVVDGFITGPCMIWKLRSNLFLNVSTRIVFEFEGDARSVSISQGRRITGVASTNLLRMLDDQTAKDAPRWARLFKGDRLGDKRKTKLKRAR